MDSKLKALEEVYAYAQRAQELGIPIEDVARLRKIAPEDRWELVKQEDYPNQVWWVFTSWEIAHENEFPTPYDWDGYSNSRHPSRSGYIWTDGPGWGEYYMHKALEGGLVPVYRAVVTDELPPAERPSAKEMARNWARKHIGRRKPLA